MLKQREVVPRLGDRSRLSGARHRHGWSQQQVADMLGTTPINVSRWERGTTTPNPYFRHKICQLFHMSMQELGLQLESQLIPGMLEGEKSSTLYDPAIPTGSVPLIGREQELSQLKQAMRAAKICYTCALTGLPGIGKTALAAELASDQEIQTSFDGGILWATLGQSPDLVRQLREWSKLLGVHSPEKEHEETIEGLTTTLRGAIGPRRFLVIIDDAWQLQDALTCKVGGAQCVYLLTTRLPQIALAFAHEETLVVQELRHEMSVNLLRLLAPEALECMEDSIDDVLSYAQGLPLALVLFGDYLRLQAYSGQQRRIRTALSRLSDVSMRQQLEGIPALHGLTKSPTEYVSLIRTIARSEKFIDCSSRAALSALAVLPKKPAVFAEETALTICGVTVEQLDMLSDVGLLESAGPGVYTLHPVIAECAQLAYEI